MNDVQLLPSDVWLEILRRIPAADLVPLKAVCKTFRRLISSDFFARLHLDDFTEAKRAMIITAPSTTTFHYDPDRRTISVWNDEPRFGDWCSHEFPHRHRHRHRVIDSYRGLLLVRICDSLLLCNPITKSYKILPPSDLVDYSWKIAYDDVSKQYKVFGLKKIINYEFSLYVFDVHGEGELRPPRKIKVMKFEEYFHEHLEECVFLGNACVFLNGSVYWLITTTLENYCATYIVSVNVSTEEMKTRSCSTILTYNYNQIFATNGKFYLGDCSHPNYDLRLWVLEGLDSENLNPNWMIKNSIKKLRLRSILYWHVKGFFRDKMLIMVSRSRRENQLYQYDLGNKKIEKVTLMMDDNNEYGVENFLYFNIVEHTDSLLSLRPIDEDVWV